jgi:acyl-CoA-binding protein
MELKEQFEEASKNVQQLSKKPKDSDLLDLYALFKQATVGDATGSRPGLFDLVGRKKFDAWVSKKGHSTDQAMQAYVDLVKKLQAA